MRADFFVFSDRQMRLQHRRLGSSGAEKESTVHRLSRACRPYATLSSNSSFNYDLGNAHTAEDKSAKSSGVKICQSRANPDRLMAPAPRPKHDQIGFLTGD
jgi:hypothetical protein